MRLGFSPPPPPTPSRKAENKFVRYTAPCPLCGKDIEWRSFAYTHGYDWRAGIGFGAGCYCPQEAS